jgi:curved DNA-binding protein CbpA
LVEEPEPTPFPIEAAGEEDVAEQPVTPVATAALPVAEEKPGPVSESAQDVRRRLLQRAFRNVAGSFGSREPHHQPGLQRPEATPLRPDAADAELEKDVSNRLMRMPAQDQFSRLDLERTATTEQVKDAFLSLAKRYHPDRITALGQNHLLPQGRELFARVKEAYDVLVDPASRARYVTELNEKDGSKSKLTPAEARTAYQQGLHHFRRRDFSKAEAEFVRAIAGEPLGDYMAELAYTLLMNPARYEDSRTEIKDLIVRALKSGNETDRTYVIAAHIARKDGENDKAEKFFRRAVEKNPKNIEAARELRLLDMRRGSGSGGKSGTGLFDRLRSKPKPPVNGKEK